MNNSQFHTLGSTISGDILTFTGVDFDHGDYFTLNTEYVDDTARIDGTNGNDFLIGTAKDEIIKGYGGNDRLRGNKGNDTIDGGLGNDVLLESATGDFFLTSDRLTNDLRGTDYFTNIEKVIIHGHHDNNLIDGSAADNRFKGFYNGHNGDDTLIGGNANDVLKGGKGEDLLIGKGGNNILFGNEGADIFALERDSGKIIVKDFQSGVDLLGLTSNLGFSDLKIRDNSAMNITYIRDITNNNVVLAVLRNVRADELSVDSFINIEE